MLEKIYGMIDALSLDEKKCLLDYLNIEIERDKRIASTYTYLEHKWNEIQRLISALDYEQMIDDQLEIEEIFDICDEIIKSDEIKQETWEVREDIIYDIVDSNFYGDYCVEDPIKDLFYALMFNREERLKIADYLSKCSGLYKQEIGARLFKECGLYMKYYLFLEDHLRNDSKPYLELIEFYQEVNIDKALEIAELGMSKCRNDLTDIIIFLLKDAKSKSDNEKTDRLLKSAKRRRNINLKKVLEALDIG